MAEEAAPTPTPEPVPTPTPIPVPPAPTAPSFFSKILGYLKGLLPTAKTVAKYVSVHVLPPLVGGLATLLLAHFQVLGTIGLTHNLLVADLTRLGAFAITSGLAFLVQHNVLKGAYSPGTRALPAAIAFPDQPITTETYGLLL